MERMTYAGSGVDYGALDPFKRRAQLAGPIDGRRDSPPRRLGSRDEPRRERVSRSRRPRAISPTSKRGSARRTSLPTRCIASFLTRSYYDHIAQDTVAMIVNDMVTLGALPLAVAMHLGVGSSDWFKDERRTADLVEGWRKACQLARCAWGGGETPTLGGVVESATVVLAGSADRHDQAERPADSGERPARRCHRDVRELRHTCQRAHACARNCGARAERLPHAACATGGRMARRCSTPRTFMSRPWKIV